MKFEAIPPAMKVTDIVWNLWKALDRAGLDFFGSSEYRLLKREGWRGGWQVLSDLGVLFALGFFRNCLRGFFRVGDTFV